MVLTLLHRRSGLAWAAGRLGEAAPRAAGGRVARCSLDIPAAGEGFVKVSLESKEPEALMELLLGVGACSASVTAHGGARGASQAILRAAPHDDTPLWERAEVSAIFEADADLDMVGEIVRAAFDLPAAPRLASEPMADRDWVVHVQRSWKPLSLGDGFEVLLPWHEGPPGGTRGRDGRIVIRLEGGEAFGLGDHPTTQGGVAFLERAVPATAGLGGSQPRVLDYGSGSGVLALCATALGATAALGVELDARAVAAARRNAELNAPAGSARAEFRQGPEDFAEARRSAQAIAAEAAGGFDILVANILRRPLVGLAPTLATLARPGAALALTGLRDELGDFEAIVAAYGQHFGHFRRVELEQGWLLVEATRL